MLADLPGAHLVGADGIPVRGDIQLINAEIRCRTLPDPFGLSLLVRGRFGHGPARNNASPDTRKTVFAESGAGRHRLMRITLKREEWGLFDYHGWTRSAR
jgi:hypothetical protein